MATDKLEPYRGKRDFTQTKEPKGARVKARRAARAFVIHKHAARRLHYDLRLEHGGVLWSWAVTRGPSLNPKDKRLAVHVEDHPLDYASFEGLIPEGSYGAGSVIVWDEGTWQPDGDPEHGMAKGHLSFTLKGRKLNGLWHLVRLKPKAREKRDNWLLMKAPDDHADTAKDILDEKPKSVRSGLPIEKVGVKSAAGKADKTPRSIPFPFIPPALASLQAKPPSGEGWLHEVKFDGYRVQVQIKNQAVTLLTRTGLDWTGRFGAPIARALAKLDCRDAIIDGEIVVMTSDGTASFAALQDALSSGKTAELVLYAFDLLRRDGSDLVKKPLRKRKAELEDLIGYEANSQVRFSGHFEDPGAVVIEHACRMGLEGIVSKRADAPYRSGRGLDWIKSKCTLRQELVIAGYIPSNKTGRPFASLLVAHRRDGVLVFAGRVGTGFTAASSAALKKKLDRLKVKASPFAAKTGCERQAVWIKPELVAEVEFRTWTRAGIVRQASFRGLREDKPANEVVAEHPEDVTGKPSANPTRTPKTNVELSNPDKLLWPDAGITKRGLLAHYELVWPRMLPHVFGRPLSLLRAPDGVQGQTFFQKHAAPGMHAAIRVDRDPETGDDLLSIAGFDGLAALVQLGAVEIHTWGATLAALETPDQIVFDLDPDAGLDAGVVRAAALHIRARLDELSLPSFVKTSGGKGYHVVVPLVPKADWATVKSFSHDFARALAQAEPDRYTATLSRKARAGRIFIDYLRNGRGSTTVCPYSTRAKPTATVSMPVPWDAIDGGIGPDAFRMGDAALEKRLRQADPWARIRSQAATLKR